MALEIEAKIPVADLKPVVDRLKSLKAVLKDTVREEDIYFDNGAVELIKKDCGLRLRRRLSDVHPLQIILTYKGPRQESAFKSRPEYQVRLDNAEAMVTIFQSLGFRESLKIHKNRQIWGLDDCEICLDEVALLGLFVEVEGVSDSVVHAVLAKLGLNPADHISEGYARMMAARLNLGK